MESKSEYKLYAGPMVLRYGRYDSGCNHLVFFHEVDVQESGVDIDTQKGFRSINNAEKYGKRKIKQFALDILDGLKKDGAK